MNKKTLLPQYKSTRILQILIRLVIALFVLLLIGYLAIGYIAADKLTYAERINNQDTPQTHGMKYENVTIPVREDRLKIAAWYIPAGDDQAAANTPAIVMVHGWNASKTKGFNWHFLDLAQALHQGGFAVLMIDLRGHGMSADSRFSFGRLERRDVLASIEFLLDKGHPSGKIGLIGVSMGAESVVGAAAVNQAVGAVLTDSLFAEIYPVVQGLWGKQSGLPQIFLYPTLWMFHLQNGFDLTSARPVDEIGQIAPRPLMLIHCQVDTDVPIAHFKQLKQAAPWAQTWVVPECRHAEIYEFVPQEYNQKVVTFFDNSLK